jgi:hypothetical protein
MPEVPTSEVQVNRTPAPWKGVGSLPFRDFVGSITRNLNVSGIKNFATQSLGKITDLY